MFDLFEAKAGMWFETLFIIFINVVKIDIIYIIFNFWDIIHYFCQIQTLLSPLGDLEMDLSGDIPSQSQSGDI